MLAAMAKLIFCKVLDDTASSTSNLSQANTTSPTVAMQPYPSNTETHSLLRFIRETAEDIMRPVAEVCHVQQQAISEVEKLVLASIPFHKRNKNWRHRRVSTLGNVRLALDISRAFDTGRKSLEAAVMAARARVEENDHYFVDQCVRTARSALGTSITELRGVVEVTRSIDDGERERKPQRSFRQCMEDTLRTAVDGRGRSGLWFLSEKYLGLVTMLEDSEKKLVGRQRRGADVGASRIKK